MGFLDAVILGIVEGLTEFLPVSSTGHLILASSLLGLAQTDYLKTFEIVIQFGAILSVVALYWRQFFNVDMLAKLAIGFIPTGVIGLLAYKVFREYLHGNESIVLWALFLGGIALIIFEYFHKEPEGDESLETVTYKQSALVGLFQTVAIVPGVSRSAASIVGGLMIGMRRQTIVEFSFLLAVPTMLAASGYDLLQNAAAFTSDQFGALAVGFLVSFFVAGASVIFLRNFSRRYTFVPFGLYRIALALLFWIVIL